MSGETAAPAARILFVDDDPLLLAGLQNLLRRQRALWEMVFVESGAEALAQLEQGRFDLIVTDMRMPRMDGVELLTRVRTQHPQTARIMLSGHTDAKDLAPALAVADALLEKPCSAADLRAAIERLCARRESAAVDGAIP